MRGLEARMGHVHFITSVVSAGSVRRQCPVRPERDRKLAVTLSMRRGSSSRARLTKVHKSKA